MPTTAGSASSAFRRWSSAVNIPWDACRDLPDDVELAIAQVATELSQQASIEIEVVTSWLQLMSYGYHEVKLFLSTETFDAARHFEVFRKRALVNGAGLGFESPGQVNRILLESRAGWTETSLLLHILRGVFTRTVYRYLAAYAPTPVPDLDEVRRNLPAPEPPRDVPAVTTILEQFVRQPLDAWDVEI